MSKYNILFIFTGSIACYKAVNVVSKLSQAGHDVECVLTTSASKFIGKVTLEGLTGNKVHTDLFEEGSVMGHIHLLRKADLVVVAPATANYINKIANGIADDLASTLFLAHDFDKPFILIPAMNTSMYEHPITQASLVKLKNLKVQVAPTGAGILACGEIGYGKMLEPEQILQEIFNQISTIDTDSVNSGSRQKIPDVAVKPVPRKKILITGGGTIEPLDSVRSITNTSTGKTATEMFHLFSDLGYEVTLLLSNGFQGEILDFKRVKRFTTFQDLHHLLKKELSQNKYDLIVHSAAVSDFSVKEISSGNKKIKSNEKIDSQKELKITLKPNLKLISKLKTYSQNKKVQIVGFKLTDDKKTEKQNLAVKKMFTYPQVEWVVHNDLSMISKDKSQHQFRFINKDFEKVKMLKGVTELVTAMVEQMELGKVKL